MPNPDPTQRRLGKIMIFVAWLLVLGLLTLFFNRWLDSQNNPNRQLNSYVTADGVPEVVLGRDRVGHYVAPGLINGQPVRFLVDTGATRVSIPAHLADRLGLQQGAPLRSLTANGPITVYATVVRKMSLGEITLYGVPADLNPYMDEEIVLLGMSFMKNLELIQKDGTLTLRQH
ncbi:MAG: TIGR02281 family clan AA aspartic protease [Candidatus Competibacteraceae bacterium]|nr:TIGR02281 family clan AA aspartic protease [Candidatus Competibacteraceae bacterium]